MNAFINMLSWWQWLIMAAIPPLIIMLYFLKLRRQPVEVSSTYLWRKTVEDLHVNSIWQRLRKNLLLLLQLLAVLAFILALLRPGIGGTATLGDRVIVMIDNSASMQATDEQKSRLQLAKEKAVELIDSLQDGDAAMVIAFSDRADVKQGFTVDKRKLKTAVESIQPTNRTTDMNEALRAASGLANPGRTSQMEDVNDIPVAEAVPATLLVLSDGGFGVPQVDLGNLSAEYIPIGSPLAENVAILAFTVERNLEREGIAEAFARVRNFGSSEQNFTASLYLDDELVDATELTLAADESSGVSFSLNAVESGAVRLDIDVQDDFSGDNVAFAGLDPPRQLDVVLVTRGNSTLEAALATPAAQAIATVRIMDEASLAGPDYATLANSGTIDLFIYDVCSPPELPMANTLFLGSIPPGEEWTAGGSTGPLFVIDTNRAHPMLQYVDMGTVRIVEGNALTLPMGATELMRSNEGVLMGVAPRGPFQDAVLGMAFTRITDDGPTPNTDWPIKRSFPVFVLNSLEYLGGAMGTASAKTIRPGESVVLNLANRFDRVQILAPTGQSTNLERGGSSQLIYNLTEAPGFYRAQQVDGDRLLQMFTVNLFSEMESDIAPASEIQIGAQQVAASTASEEAVRVEFWRWLVLLALAILTLEWYLYNRRVAV